MSLRIGLLSSDRFRETLQTSLLDLSARRTATVTVAQKPNGRGSVQRAGVYDETSLRLRLRRLQGTNRNGRGDHRGLRLNRLGRSFLRHLFHLLSHVGRWGTVQIQFILHRSCQLLLVSTFQESDERKQLSSLRRVLVLQLQENHDEDDYLHILEH